MNADQERKARRQLGCLIAVLAFGVPMAVALVLAGVAWLLGYGG